MDDKTKLYAFTKFEIGLIFFLMLFMGVTSFLLGVTFGKKYSYEKAGYAVEDKQTIELLSQEEETVNKVVKEQEFSDIENEASVDKNLVEDINKNLADKLKEELSAEDRKMNKPQSKLTDEVIEKKTQKIEETKKVIRVAPPESFKGSDQSKYVGQYTIQLASYRSIKEAKEFAQGFQIRGYNPIINEAEIAGRGTWYRVSLGAFKTREEAKDYITQEASLFQGQDYDIRRF